MADNTAECRTDKECRNNLSAFKSRTDCYCGEHDFQYPRPTFCVAADNGVFDYIQQHFAEPIALETLASLATFSPSYFSRLFKACTGIGVTEYIQQVRVHRACQLLRETSRSVPEISEEIGYGDANYFGKVFKRQIGLTPAAYRKKHR